MDHAPPVLTGLVRGAPSNATSTVKRVSGDGGLAAVFVPSIAIREALLAVKTAATRIQALELGVRRRALARAPARPAVLSRRERGLTSVARITVAVRETEAAGQATLPANAHRVAGRVARALVTARAAGARVRRQIDGAPATPTAEGAPEGRIRRASEAREDHDDREPPRRDHGRTSQRAALIPAGLP